MSSVDEIHKDLDELKQKIKDLDVKLNKLLDWIEQDGTKMSEHIDFVENVYDRVKQPFNFIMDNVTHVLYNKNPFIEYPYEEIKEIN